MIPIARAKNQIAWPSENLKEAFEPILSDRLLDQFLQPLALSPQKFHYAVLMIDPNRLNRRRKSVRLGAMSGRE